MATVLVVEDDFAILFVAESTLRIDGHKTFAAATRKDALAILKSEDVDVLFTDINLRGDKRAGLELAEKAITLKPNLGVLYTTGGELRASGVPGSEFLPKPYTSSELKAAVETLLQAA